MIYPYKCQCGHTEDVWKPVAQCSNSEPCPKCATIMNRIYTVPRVSVVQSEYFHTGLGTYVKNAWDAKEGIKRYNEKHNADLQPMEAGMVRKRPEGVSLSKEDVEQISARLDAPAGREQELSCVDPVLDGDGRREHKETINAGI